MKVTAFVAAALSVAAVAEAANSHGVRRQDTAHHQHARAPAPTPAPEADPEALLGGGLKSLLNKFAATPVKQASADPAAVTEIAGGKPKIDASKLTLPKTNAQTGRTDITTIMSRLANMFKGFGQEPTVTLRQGTYTGVRSSALFQQEWFLGIPFAAKQDKSTRFLSPRKTPDSTSSFNASSLAAACPQPNNYLMNFDADPSSRSEDCLTVNVWSPLGASAGNVGNGKLPVLFWLYGGGEIGNAHNVYNSSALVLQSILQFQPMIVITPNYRGNSFGFLAGETMTRLTKRNKATLNAGLQDVTAALEWTRDNIAAFGGDPNKITLAGQSSGAFNVGAQMLKDGATPSVKPIYRAAVMISGTSSSEPAPASDSAFAQQNFQRIVDVVGCTKNRNNFPSTEAFDDALLDCLRNVDPIELGEATFKPLDYRWGVNPSLFWILGPNFYAGNQPFQPTKDGVYHRADGSAEQIRQGLYPDVPLLIGNVRDEGTIFVSRTLQAGDIKANLKTIGFTNPNAAGVDALVDDILAAYPDVPTQGAPYLPGYRGPDSRFGAGNQFERLAAILGDFAFVSKRRFILDRWIGANGMSKFQSPVWSYMFNETDGYQPPEDQNGIPHGYDPSYWFAGRAFAPNPAWLSAASASLQASKSFVAFVNKMNPNAFGNLYWPQYTASNRVQMMIKGSPKLIGDDYRPQMSIFSTKRVTDLSNM